MFSINSLGGYELHFCCTVLSLLFQKSLSRSLQRPETRGERRGKYKREKLNSCRGECSPPPPASRCGRALRRETDRRTGRQVDGRTDGAGQSCGETGWEGEKDAEGLERAAGAATPHVGLGRGPHPDILGSRVQRPTLCLERGVGDERR